MARHRRMAKQHRTKSTTPQPVRPPSAFGWTRIVRLVLIVGVLSYLFYRQQQAEPPVAPRPDHDRSSTKVEVQKGERPATNPSATLDQELTDTPTPDPMTSDASTSLQTVIPNVEIKNRQGNVVYRGSVDLADTIARIDRDETLSQFPNDGSVFQNRERRLPNQPRGYYREWVHETPGERGPGPQRIVSGKPGEYWYTPDHYETFQPLHRADE